MKIILKDNSEIAIVSYENKSSSASFYIEGISFEEVMKR